MSYLYVCEQGSVINFEGERFSVKYKDGLIKSIPAETLENIEIFGNIQLTTQCIRECLTRGINVIFFSSMGAYFGRLISTNHINTHRQRLQAKIYDDEEFKTKFSRKIIQAKINNQIVVARRYARTVGENIGESINRMQYMSSKIERCHTIEEIMGCEGTAAREYFTVLGKLINSEFEFSKRTRRPPTDPFNSCISLGYSIIMNEIYGRIEAKGLNPYFGIMHKDREKHPTLASDLIEEWRATIVDSVTMSLINGHELLRDDFYTDSEQPGVFLNNTALKTFLLKIEKKMRTDNKYLSYIDYSVNFRRAIDLQIDSLVKAIETNDIEEYKPLRIR